MSHVIDILKERGFIEAMTSDDLMSIDKKPFKVYCGFDPTGDSLHIGHMVALMGLAWFQRFGHTPVAIVGGATGMIGDPSGKSLERNLLDEETLQHNIEGIEKNLKTLLDYSRKDASPIILNNFDWFKGFSFIDFLRDVGKYFRVGPMLAKDSVKQRMQSEEGMSFTEFSYQLLQGYDFLHLFDEHGVTVQIGGSDQWGNITAGTELIRKVRAKTAYGITFPLLTRSDGQKFGKTEQGAIWLSPEKCSPYDFYQYFIRVADADVIKLMRLLTFMDMNEIREIEAKMKLEGYQPNTAQKRLAEEITRLVHGEAGLSIALKVTEAAAPGSDTELNADTLERISQDMTNHELKSDEIVGQKIIDVLVKLSLVASKGDARRLVRNGGVYLNNAKINDENAEISQIDLLDGRILLLATGKKNKVVVRIRS